MFNLFKSKKKKGMYEDINTVHYSVDLLKTDYKFNLSTEDYFKLWIDYPATKSCSWIKDMPLNVNSMNKNFEAEKDPNLAKLEADYVDYCVANNIPPDTDTRSRSYFSTAKMCPAITDLLSHSFVVKAPVDIHVSVAQHGKNMEHLLHHVFVDVNFSQTRPHGKIQYTCKDSPMFKDMVNFKIETGIILHAHKDVMITFMQPVYHNHPVPWQVIPGVFTDPLNGYASVIINTFVPNNSRDFIIKKGTALFYGTFSRKVRLVPTDEPNNKLIKTTLNKPSVSTRHEIGK